MPRTTIDIEAPILDELKLLGEKQGVSLGELASNLLAAALADRRKPSIRRLRWNTRPMEARLSIEDKEAVWAILDQPKPRRRK